MEGKEIFSRALEWLDNYTDFAVVGATTDPEKYGFKYVQAYAQAGYRVTPVNPKYQQVLGIPCKASLKEVSPPPQVVIAIVSPRISMKVAQECAGLGLKRLWLPPETWNDEILEYCQGQGLEVVHDICPLMALKYFTKGKGK